VAYAETQSMFLDSLVDDAAWLGRYARSREGKPMPWELVEAGIRATHPTAVLSLRAWPPRSRRASRVAPALGRC
jgi:hypothetical protein